MPKLPYVVVFDKTDNCTPVLCIDEVSHHDNTRISGIPMDFERVIMFNGSLDECFNYCEKYAKANVMFKHIVPDRDENRLWFSIYWKFHP